MPEGLIYLLALSLAIALTCVFIRLIYVSHSKGLLAQQLHKELHINNSENVFRFGSHHTECEFCETLLNSIKSGDDKSFMLAIKRMEIEKKKKEDCSKASLTSE